MQLMESVVGVGCLGGFVLQRLTDLRLAAMKMFVDAVAVGVVVQLG